MIAFRLQRKCNPSLEDAARKLTLVGCALTTIGVWGFVEDARQPKPGEWLTALPARQVVTELTAGESCEVRFQLLNRNTRHEVRVTGVVGGCSAQGCIGVQPVPATIPPGGMLDLVVNYKSPFPGQFSRVVTIYTNCPGQEEIHITVVASVRPTSETDTL